MINDAHCHFFSTPFFAPLGGDAALAKLGWDAPGTPDALADRWVAELDRHQVSRAALIASVPDDAASVAAAVRRHPGRFVGFFMVDPTQPNAAAKAADAIGRGGMRGICLFPAMHRYAIQDDRANDHSMDVDADRILRERTSASPRRSFLRRAAVVAAVPAIAVASATKGFAASGNTLPTLYPGWNARNFKEIQADENAHVPFLINAITSLGGVPRPRPSLKNLNFPNAHNFAAASQTFENTGVGAYQAAAPLLSNPTVLAAAVYPLVGIVLDAGMGRGRS